jgi:hypothetical protein
MKTNSFNNNIFQYLQQIKYPSLSVSQFDFKLPIQYCEHYPLTDTLMNDLQFVPQPQSTQPTITTILLQPSNEISQKLCSKNIFYTTDIEFLQQTQDILRNTNIANIKSIDETQMQKNIQQFEAYNSNTHFLEKYMFNELKIFEQLNTQDIYLLFLSYLQISSLFFSCIMPFIIMVIYYLFSSFFCNETMGFFTHFIAINSPLYVLAKSTEYSLAFFAKFIGSLIFYFYNCYNSVKIYVKYYNNTKQIKKDIETLKQHIELTNSNYNTFYNILCNNNAQKYYNFMRECSCNIIEPLNNILQQSQDVGNINAFKIYYQLYSNEHLKKSIISSFYFNSYLEQLKTLHLKCQTNEISFCDFYNSTKNDNNDDNQTIQFYLKDFYHPNVGKNAVRNSCDLNDANEIISGINASGKTTYLKSILLNTILSQQFGVGYYSKFNFAPFRYFHSYLNIPDTMDRESLFQLEAKRCKEILNCINDVNQEENHFCIFDELFSGTNPEEAIFAGISFLDYLKQKNNVRFLLTTHFKDICHYFENEFKNNNNNNKLTSQTKNTKLKIKNSKMKIQFDNDLQQFQYYYMIEEGICNEKGGYYVLKELNFPKEILDKCKQLEFDGNAVFNIKN